MTDIKLVVDSVKKQAVTRLFFKYRTTNSNIAVSVWWCTSLSSLGYVSIRTHCKNFMWKLLPIEVQASGKNFLSKTRVLK